MRELGHDGNISTEIRWRLLNENLNEEQESSLQNKKAISMPLIALRLKYIGSIGRWIFKLTIGQDYNMTMHDTNNPIPSSSRSI